MKQRIDPETSVGQRRMKKSGAFFMTDSQGNKFSWRKKNNLKNCVLPHIYTVKQLCPLRGGVLINVGEAC
jgi:hypothetical protein